MCASRASAEPHSAIVSLPPPFSPHLLSHPTHSPCRTRDRSRQLRQVHHQWGLSHPCPPSRRPHNHQLALVGRTSLAAARTELDTRGTVVAAGCPGMLDTRCARTGDGSAQVSSRGTTSSGVGQHVVSFTRNYLEHPSHRGARRPEMLAPIGLNGGYLPGLSARLDVESADTLGEGRSHSVDCHVRMHGLTKWCRDITEPGADAARPSAGGRASRIGSLLRLLPLVRPGIGDRGLSTG